MPGACVSAVSPATAARRPAACSGFATSVSRKMRADHVIVRKRSGPVPLLMKRMSGAQALLQDVARILTGKVLEF